MGNHPMWQNLFRSRPDRLTEATRLWRDTPLFEGIAERHARQLVAGMHHRSYADGEAVFRQGDAGAGVALVSAGGVVIQSGETLLAELSPGDFFGEVALVDDEPRTADALARGETELVFLMRPNLHEWVQRSPRSGSRFMTNLAHVLAGRLRRANERMQQDHVVAR